MDQPGDIFKILKHYAINNYYMYSFMPRTVVEWNILLATIRDAPSVDTSKARLYSIKFSTHFTRNKIA